MGLFRAQSNLTGRIYPFNIAGDTPTPEEDAFISKYIVDTEKPGPSVEEETEESSIFGQAVGRGTDLIQRSLGSALEGIGKTTGIEAIEDYGAEVVENNNKEIQENSDKAVRLKDINDIGSFFDWTASTLGEQLPNLGYTLGGSAAGAAAGSFLGPAGIVAGGIIGGVGFNLPFFYGSNREAQKEEIEKGNRIVVSEGAAALTAIPQSVLDFIADKFLVSGFTGKLLSGGGFFTRGAKGIVKGALVEVPTEIGQQVLERAQAGKDLGSDEAIDEYIEVAAAAGLLGGTVKGTGQAIFGKKDPSAENKNLELMKDTRVQVQQAKVMQQNAEEIVSKIKANPNVQPEEETANNINKKETKTQDLLDAAKETTTGYNPIKLSDLNSKDAQKIRMDRINVRRDSSPSDTDADTTIDEITEILGEDAATREKIKQKPNLMYQTILDLDNDLVNLDGSIESKMKEKKKLESISKKPKDESQKLDAEEKIKIVDQQLQEITEAKKIKEEKYKGLINNYISTKQKKELKDLQYLDLQSEKADPQAEKIATSDEFQPTEEYFNKKDRIQEELQKELNNLGLKDVKVRIDPVVAEQEGKVVEGFFATEDGQKVIALSMALYDPNMSDAQLKSKLRSVMRHEILHAVKKLEIITPKEYKVLVKAAEKRKYVVIENGKLIERSYTYLDRANLMHKNSNLTEEEIAEEAVAELFRDYADDKIKLVAQPKTIFDKIINAIKAIFNAHSKLGFTEADQIFQNILSTDTEKNIRTTQDIDTTDTRKESSVTLEPSDDEVSTPYDQKVQDALSAYAKGNLTAKETRKVIKDQGYQLDGTGLRTNFAEINVFPSNEKMKDNVRYAPQVYAFSAIQTEEDAGSLLQFIKDNPDGFTVDIDTLDFTPAQKGVAVAPVKPAEMKLDLKNLTIDKVYEFAETVTQMAKLGNVKMYAGGWYNRKTKDNPKGDNKFYLDSTMVVDSVEEALYIAESGKQKAVFNLTTFEETETRNGIKQLKQTRAYDREAHNVSRRYVQQLTEEFKKARDRGEIKSRVRDGKRDQEGVKGRPSTENKGLTIEPSTDENGLVTLTHYSPISGLEEIKPEFQGTNEGMIGQEKLRRRYFAKDYPARNYYGLEVDKDYGYKKEDGGTTNVGDNVYEAKVPLENLYNMDLDDQNLKPIAIKQAEGDPDQSLYAATLLEKSIKEKGFIGYYSKNASLGLVAAVFQPLSVKPAKNKKFSSLLLPGGAKDISPFLLYDEAQYIFEGTGAEKRTEKLLDLFTKYLPSSFEMANVAIAGSAKKGWYRQSAQAIQDLFGIHDARRFVALLAATSPQVSVSTNLEIALKIWVNWNNSGRPKDFSVIDQVATEAVGNRYMQTLRNNVQRSLSVDDGQEMGLLISGPKVNSFMLNLVDNVMEVTNDTWMATYAAIDIDPKTFQTKLKRNNPTQSEIQAGRGIDDVGVIAQKSVDYIALSAKTREAAKVASEITGELWTPAEIQETVWSITRALGTLRRKSPKSASELLLSGSITDTDVAGQDDFATLLSQGLYERILERGGYGQRLRAINTAETGRIDPREEGSVLRTENRKVDPNTFRPALIGFANRIETNVTTARINKKYSSLPVQPEFDVVSSPAGKKTFGIYPFRGRPLQILFPVGRHFGSKIEMDQNMQFGDTLGSFGLTHISSNRPGIKRNVVNHAKDLLRFTNYKSPEEGVYAMMSKLREFITPNERGQLIVKPNKDFEIEENFDKGNVTIQLTPQSKINNRKAGSHLAPLKLVLQKGSRMKKDPLDTSGLPPVGSFENPNIPEGATFFFIKTFYNEDPKFSALEVTNPIPETAVETDEKIQAKEENIRYNNLAPFLAKPLKIVFGEDKGTALAEKIVVKYQDAFQPVGKMLDELRKNGLSIADALDPYLKEKLFHGKVKDLSIKAYEKFYTPMGELIEQIKVTQSELDALEATKGTIAFRVYKDKYPDIRLALADLYLYARHAKSRNEFVRKRTGRALGSSMSDSEADIYLNWFNNLDDNGVFAEIASLTKQITDDTTSQRQKSGLIPESEDEAFKELVNYVPLRGDISQDKEISEDLSDAIIPRTMGTFFGGKGRPDPSITKGRPYKDASYAEFIIPTLMSQNQKTIELSERNKVGLSFLNLIRGKDTSVENEGSENSDLAENMKYIAEVVDSDLLKQMSKADKALHVVSVRENGQDVSIYVRDSRIARAMKYHYSPDTVSSLVRAMSQLNRFLSNVNTSWNPSFVIPNLARDLETAGVNIQQYGEKGITKEIMYNAFKAIAGIKRNIRDNDTDSEWAKEYLLFRENGGQNATNQMGDLETQVNNLKEVLDSVANNSRQGKLGLVKNAFVGKGKSLLKFLDDWNTAVENGVRVATFRALRNRGMSIERAAEASRDITVNFAKGGEDKTFMNAWFLFYNASLQGSMALFNAAVKSPTVRKFWGGMIVYGILQDQVMAMLSGDEDEDGILDYDELSTYELEHNLILPIKWDDKMVKIPLAYGLNMAVNTGRSLSRLARGEYTAGEATNSILATLTEMVNPLGGTESFVNFLAPTVADPFVSLYINKDYKGDPITKDSPTFASVPTPDSHSHWNTTGEIPKAIAQTLNKLGGNELRSGLIDLSPDTIQFWFDYITGGAGRFVLRTGETLLFDVPEILTGDFEGKIIPRIPLARKVVATPSEVADTGTYLENRKELFTIFAELDLARRSGDTERLKDVMDKYGEELKVYGRMKAIDNARNRLLRQIKKIERNPRLEEDRKKQLIKRIRKKINEFQKQGLILMRSAGLREAS